jgi:DNA-binding CsgD family transcriptional regulator
VTQSHSLLKLPTLSLPLDHILQTRDQRQADPISNARTRAANDVGAAAAHQLNEPLTALLLYLDEIKDLNKETTRTDLAANSMRQMLESAFRETERVCAIIEQLGHPFEAPDDAEPAIALGREAIDSWTRGRYANGNGNAAPMLPPSRQNGLTAREREVLGLIIDGAANKLGAHQLGISKRTFEVHRAHIMKKFRAKNTADLVRMALSEMPSISISQAPV